MAPVNNLLRNSHTGGTATTIPGTFEVKISPTETLTMENPVLIAGGGTGHPSFPQELDFTVAEIYDWGTNRFYQIASLTEGRKDHIAEALIAPDGTPLGVLVAGGIGPGFCTNTAEVWEIATQTWRPVAPMRHCRRDARSVRFFTGEILVVGGAGDSSAGRTAEIFQYDSGGLGSWRPTAPLNCSHQGRHSATLILAASPKTQDHPELPRQSRVIVAGGFDEVRQNASDCAELYSLIEDRWIKNTMVAPQIDHVAFLLSDPAGTSAGTEGVVVIAGGADTASFDLTKRTQVVDVAHFSAGWISKPSMDLHFLRYEHGASTYPRLGVLGPSGQVHGGRTFLTPILVYNRDETFQYDAPTRVGSWTFGPNHASPRLSFLVAEHSPGGGRLLAGGLDYDTPGDFFFPLRDGELY